MLSTVAMFVAGFLAWCVLPHHKPDWRGLSNEAEFMSAVREMNIPPGNYMVPYAADNAAMQSEEFKQKMEEGPVGTLQVWEGPPPMGKNLVCQALYLLIVNFCLAYLATLALVPGADFLTVFRFMATAAFLTFTVAVVPGAIWLKLRLPGYIVDGVIHAVIAGLLFAWLWPEGPAI